MRAAPLLATAAVFAGAAGSLAPAGLAGAAGAPAGASLAGTAGALAGSSPANASEWSSPGALSACPAAAAPLLAFPSDRPDHATGPGAVVWSASQRCPGGEGARVAAIGADDVPAGSTIPRTAAARELALRGALTVADGPHGQIVIAGEGPRAGAGETLIEGSALGPFAPLSTPGGPLLAPPALATAYLGDVALLAPTPAARGQQELRLEVERYFARGLGRGVGVDASGAGSTQALTLAMDYRSDALAVWRQADALYARELPASGVVHQAQRLAATGSHLRVAALLSDDNHAILAWSEQRAGQTFVYLDISASGVRFGTPRLLERFSNPEGLPAPAASPNLIRLSSESVMMAWAGSAEGRWAVRLAAIDLQGPQPASTLLAPDGGQALLAGLAAGPHGEALALWTEPLQSASGAAGLRRQAIFAARGVDASSGRVIFDAPEQVAAPAPIGQPSVAFDPGSDRAVAVWQGEGSSIDYAIRAASRP